MFNHSYSLGLHSLCLGKQVTADSEADSLNASAKFISHQGMADGSPPPCACPFPHFGTHFRQELGGDGVVSVHARRVQVAGGLNFQPGWTHQGQPSAVCARLPRSPERRDCEHAPRCTFGVGGDRVLLWSLG